MKKPTLAVLMTCHNRQAKTLTCLQALYTQKYLPNVEIQVYLVDDGSTDGTGESVRSNYPEVRVLEGSGDLFWCGGMRLAFEYAIKCDYDYYLWLNDDTLLYEDALGILLTTSNLLINQGYHQAIVIGSTQDPETGAFTYGGRIRESRWHPLKFAPLEPGKKAKPCLTMNGNCVLIPRTVAKAVGNLDKAFTHSTGDIDYGLRAQQQGCSVWVTPGYVGTCKHNVIGVRAWDEPNITLRERWFMVNQSKGLPISEWKTFAYRHAGLLWPIYFVLPYLRLFLNAIFLKNVKNNQVKASF